MELRSSKAKLFLIELIIIILFFAFAAGVCMNMFAVAKKFSTESVDMTRASMVAQSAAEAIKSGGEDGFVEALDAQGSAGSYEVYYDENWIPAAGEAVYTLKVGFTEEEGGVLCADVKVQRADNVIYNITAKQFTGK